MIEARPASRVGENPPTVTAAKLAARSGMSPKAVRAQLRARFGDHEPGSRWVLTEQEAVDFVDQCAGGGSGVPLSIMTDRFAMQRREGKDQDYVLDICDEILGGRGERERRFDWLRGDQNAAGRRSMLPVDGYYPDSEIVVEYWEKQHTESVPHFDKPEQLTVSGVSRAAQRRRYDELRQNLIPEHGLRLVIIRVADLASRKNGKLRRRRGLDVPVIEQLLAS